MLQKHFGFDTPGDKRGAWVLLLILPGGRRCTARCIDCDEVQDVRIDQIRDGSSTRCLVCRRRDTFNPYKQKLHPLHTIYVRLAHQEARCTNKSNASFDRYGARGITVCERYSLRFHFNAFGSGRLAIENVMRDIGIPPDCTSSHTLDDLLLDEPESEIPFKTSYQIDRIDNSKGYGEGNIRWATPETNNNNRDMVLRLDSGSPLPLEARSAGINPRTAAARRRKGATDSEALSPDTATDSPAKSLAIATYGMMPLSGAPHGKRIFVSPEGLLFDLLLWRPLIAHRTSPGYWSLKFPREVLHELSLDHDEVSKDLPSVLHHRLVYVVAAGHIPSRTVIDHIDGNPSNDAVGNLRAVSNSQNSLNRHPDAQPRIVVDYADHALYHQLAETLRAPAMAPTTPLPMCAEMDGARELFDEFFKAEGRDLVLGNRHLAISILSAPDNMARRERESLLIETFDKEGKGRGPAVLAHSRNCPGRLLARWDHVSTVCLDCGFVAPRVTQVNNRLARTRRPVCPYCRSLAIRAPRLAELMTSNPITGESFHALDVPAATRDITRWFRCSVEGCAFPVSVEVKPMVSRGTLPICERHRNRAANFDGRPKAT